jgi:hypothetical protein
MNTSNMSNWISHSKVESSADFIIENIIYMRYNENHNYLKLYFNSTQGINSP